MSGIGYTQKQAERLKGQLDRSMAKIEAEVATLGKIVTDTGADVWFGREQLEELHENVDQLKAIIDRRTWS